MAASQQGKSAKSTTEMKKTEALARNKRRRNIWSVLLFAIGIMLTAFSLIGNVHSEAPNMWDYIHGFFCGVFGATVFFIGPLLIYVAIMISLDKGRATIKARILQITLFIFLLSAAIQIIFIGPYPDAEGFGEVIGEIYTNGTHLKGGGVCSLLIGFPLLLLGRVGATIAIILIIFVIIMLIANISLMDFLKLVAKPFVKLGVFLKEKRLEYEEESRYVREERELMEAAMAEQEQDDDNGKDRLANKFSSSDAMTKGMREEDSVPTAEKVDETKAIVDEQTQESNEYLKKIGAKSPHLVSRLTDEDYQRMSTSEFLDLIEEHNKYVRKKYSHPVDVPQFNSIEELRQYYGCRHLDEALDRINQLFEDQG